MKRIIQTGINTSENDNGSAVIKDTSIRPSSFDEYIGQENIVKLLQVAIKSAKIRQKAIDHVLLYGPPGLGKTTLANMIANEMNVTIKTIMGPSIEKPGDIASVLCALQNKDILFIDEIHRMNRAAEEVLYSAMEDGYINILIGQGEQVKQLHVDLPPFTLIGATTRVGMLSAPLRDRFGIHCELNYYNETDLSRIVIKTADKLGITLSKKDALIIAQASQGTPRLANRLVLRIRDYAYSENKGIVTEDTIKNAMHLLGVYECGINEAQKRLMTKLMCSSKPTGLKTLAVYIGESSETVEEVIEPYLIQRNLIEKTASGRVLTEEGLRVLKTIL